MDFGEQYPYYAARLMKQSWACSSVGRAPALQAGGPEFESLQVHHDFPVFLPPLILQNPSRWPRGSLSVKILALEAFRHPAPLIYRAFLLPSGVAEAPVASGLVCGRRAP